MSGPHRSLRTPTEDQPSRSNYFHVDGGVEIHIERPRLSFQEMSL
jgi:hypothetical protein